MTCRGFHRDVPKTSFPRYRIRSRSNVLEYSISLDGAITKIGIANVTEVGFTSLSADDGETSTVPIDQQPPRLRREEVNVDQRESPRINDQVWRPPRTNQRKRWCLLAAVI